MNTYYLYMDENLFLPWSYFQIYLFYMQKIIKNPNMVQPLWRSSYKYKRSFAYLYKILLYNLRTFNWTKITHMQCFDFRE